MPCFLPCAAIDCGPPDAIADGSVEYNSTTFTAVARYKCNFGYSLQGSENRSCLGNATWQPSPFCRSVSCPPIKTYSNVIVGGPFTFKTSLIFTCPLGHKRIGPAEISCHGDRTWTDDPPRCDLITCNSPGMSTGTTSQGTLMVYNSSIHYQCLQGYQKASGSNVITCQLSGDWSGSPLQCSPVPCPDLPLIQNGGPEIGTNFSFGSNVTYVCNDGYSIVGQEVLTCLDGGVWSHPLPRCEGEAKWKGWSIDGLIPKLLEIEKRLCVRLRSGDKHHLRKSADRKTQTSLVSGTTAFMICALRPADFLKWCLSPERNLAHNLFFYFQ